MSDRLKAVDRADRTVPDRILDAAEKLWASESYEGASIRRIMAEADLEFSLARYYFGRKEDLFRQVIARRAPEMQASFAAAFDRAVERAGNGVPALEAWIDALVQPSFDYLEGENEGWRNYARLVSDSAMKDQSLPYLSALHDYMFPVIERFVEGLDRIIPGLTAEQRMWGAYFLQGASISIFRNPSFICQITRGTIVTENFSAVREVIAPFFAAGFRGFLAGDGRVPGSRGTRGKAAAGRRNPSGPA